MDPQACFEAFVGACEDGDYDCGTDAEESYNDWIAKGGYPADDRGAKVLRCDLEKDRYLVNADGIERWRVAKRRIEI